MPKAKKLKETSAGPIDHPSFEQALKELEEIVGKLEAGQLALDDALALFERGQQLTAWCGTHLENAELKIQKLAPQLDHYELQTFDEVELET